MEPASSKRMDSLCVTALTTCQALRYSSIQTTFNLAVHLLDVIVPSHVPSRPPQPQTADTAAAKSHEAEN